ncbi:MAG: hypothetical protein EP329_17305 [Deltaproteobacteria bacterium]|nr:MAG: hypothetical protein EP329_17305 [Deltaproteobacteria bacterium]
MALGSLSMGCSEETSAATDTAPEDTGGRDTALVGVTWTCPASVDASDPGSPLEGLVQLGRTERVRVGESTDDYLYNASETVKIGVRRAWGASVVFFGQADGAPGMNETNVIDGHDTGREVQIALYDRDRLRQVCAATASCRFSGTPCADSITYLGWNPVQGGNECGVGSPVESATADPGALRAVVHPLHWNPDWGATTCTNDGCADPDLAVLGADVRYTQRLRFVADDVVEMDMFVENLADLDHAATEQELPTLYASYGAYGPNLDQILDSTGAAVAVDIPANDGFFTRSFTSPGGYATLQNAAHDYGVGIYYEGYRTSFQAWQKAGIFNNVRAKWSFGLPAYGSVRSRAYLLLGSQATIAERVGWLDTHLAPFGEIETPAPDEALGDSVTVTGWALDNHGVTGVYVRVDGQVVDGSELTVRRPDICTRWPGFGMCANPIGFSVTVPVSDLPACAHLLDVRAHDADGNARVIARRRVFTGATGTR